jgi:hypothetical protein
MITTESVRVLENNLAFAKGVNREYDDSFAQSGAKIGDTLNVRKPARYLGRSGQTLAIEDHTETSVPLQLNTQFGVDVQFTSKDMALSLDDFSDRFIKPAMAVVANKIDRDGLALYKDVFNTVGTPGTTPTLLRTYLQAGAKLDFEGAPKDNMRSAIIDPNAQVELIDSLKGLFQSTDKIASQYESGNMGQAAGFKFSMDQNVNVHTVGPQGGVPIVNGAGQTGSNLVTSGWTASAALRLYKGDVFTIAGVFAVNPQTRQSTGQLRQFTVTADTSSDGTGAATIPIYPAIVTSGAFQTVTASPAGSAALTVFAAGGTLSPANLVFHRDAFTFACADLPLPKGVDMAARVSSKQLGMSVRMVRNYDIVNDRFPCRLDVLYGWKTIYPELAARVMG